MIANSLYLSLSTAQIQVVRALAKIWGGWGDFNSLEIWVSEKKTERKTRQYINLELVSKELSHLAAIFHVYAASMNFMK